MYLPVAHPLRQQKQRYIDESDAPNLVAYEWENVDEWRSVVISGRLIPVDDDSPEAIEAAEIFAEHGSVVGLSVFNTPMEELDTEWYELRIEEIQGYQSPLVD